MLVSEKTIASVPQLHEDEECFSPTDVSREPKIAPDVYSRGSINMYGWSGCDSWGIQPAPMFLPVLTAGRTLVCALQLVLTL